MPGSLCQSLCPKTASFRSIIAKVQSSSNILWFLWIKCVSFYAPFLERILFPFPDSQPCSQGMRLLCLWHLEKWRYLTWHLLLNLQFIHSLKKLSSIYCVPSAVVYGWNTKINTQCLPQGVHRLENWFSISSAVLEPFGNLIKAHYIRGYYLLSTYYMPGSVPKASKAAYFNLQISMK